jgi:hypothetical protein
VGLAVAGDVGGGEVLPCDGNCPPAEAVSLPLLAAGLRVGLAPALLNAAAKPWPLMSGAAESAEAVPFVCAAPLLTRA